MTYREMLKGLSLHVIGRRRCWDPTVTLQRRGRAVLLFYEDYPKVPEKFELEPASPINGNQADEEADDWELYPKARA